MFDPNGDGPAPKARAQLGDPRANDFRLLLQGAGFLFRLARDLQAEDVLLVGPIDGDEGRVLVGGADGWLVRVHRFKKTRWPILAKGL